LAGVASSRSFWVSRPLVDLLVGCGGWSLPLLLASYWLVDADARRWSSVFYALALACNYPHYMATIHRAYFRQADRDRYRLVTHYLTAGLVLLAVAAHVRPALLPWLFTAYVMWSPWHYTGQNFGLAMMFMRRAGVPIDERQRRRLRLAFAASYVMLLAAFNEAGAGDPLVLSLHLPVGLAFPLQAFALVMFLLLALPTLGTLVARAGWRPMVAPLTLVATQTLWFVAPIALTWTGAVSLVQTRYSSGILAVMHSAQYLWITQHYARRDAALGAGEGGSWSGARYWVTLVAGGIALFVPGPWLASHLGHVDFTTSMLIVTSIVNLHHFIVDGVVWKLRDKRVSSVLVQESAGAASTLSAPAAASAVGAPAAAAASVGRRWTLRLAQIGAVVALVALAAIDQWRYRLSIPGADVASLAAARRLNPWDTPVNLWLARTGLRGGDAALAERELRAAVAAPAAPRAAFAALERLLVEQRRYSETYDVVSQSLRRWPDDVDALVNAGVLALRLERRTEAEQWWRRALQRNDALGQVHLYLAELLDSGNRPSEAIPHYQRHLELMAGQPETTRSSPRGIALVVVKFGDALSRTGRPDLARTQYQLADRIATRTGLADVAELVRARLPSVHPHQPAP
jgi:tetratricopeptide (TPR) repeat protein